MTQTKVDVAVSRHQCHCSSTFPKICDFSLNGRAFRFLNMPTFRCARICSAGALAIQRWLTLAGMLENDKHVQCNFSKSELGEERSDDWTDEPTRVPGNSIRHKRQGEVRALRSAWPSAGLPRTPDLETSHGSLPLSAFFVARTNGAFGSSEKESQSRCTR